MYIGHGKDDIDETEEEVPESEEDLDVEANSCPVGMQPIPRENPSFCLDMYEVEVRDGIAHSESGRNPSTLISFAEAKAFCEATPILNEAGEHVAEKRLVSLSEWIDAADGVHGEGGNTYTYGNQWSDSSCATPLHDGTVVYDAVQESGLFPDCVSDFGIYDQIGNVWEWADPQRDIDIEGFFRDIAEGDLSLEATTSSRIVFEGVLERLWLDVPGAQNQLFHADDGRLYAADISDDMLSMDTDILGYLRYNFIGSGVAGSFLPVRILREQEQGLYPIEIVWSRDASPLTAKVGCSYYVGNSSACRIENVQSSHAYDFLGSIGFRCAVDYPFE